MVNINGYFIFILVTVVGFYLLDVVSNWLNLGALQAELPAEFEDVFDREKYAESQRYTRVTTRFELFESTVTLVVFLAFWWSGGFGWLDRLVRSWSGATILTGLAYMGLLYLGARLISLPFEWYDTFVIEERFGFNKTDLRTFLADRIKGLALAIALGAPLMALVIYLFERFDRLAWFYGWVAVAGFSIILAYLAPQIILPLFHKFKPLDEGELKAAIQNMSERCKFPLQEVFEIDGSRRSSKSNAFFTGFGKHKKIALYDTLIKNHSVGELVAVLAHEVGHYKKKHVLQTMTLTILQMGVLFFLLGFFMKNEGLFRAFGVAETSVYGSLVFFSFLFEPVNKLLSMAMMVLSRKNEYEADAYAAKITGRPEDLINGLKRLSQDNLSNLTPHPFFVFLNYSHPPMLQRIAALENAAVADHV